MYDTLLAHCGRYTFGRVEGHDAYVPGTWDIVKDALHKGLITGEEYTTLLITDINRWNLKNPGGSEA